jgi:hypothetical protein
MRCLISGVSIVALLAAQVPTTPAFAQSPVTPVNLQTQPGADVYGKMFAAFPNGGEQLSNQIADIIVANPKIAPQLVSYAQAAGLNRLQKIALEHGFAQALKRMGINAADLGVPTKAQPSYPPAPAVVEEGFEWWWLVLAAAVIAGVVVCAIECFHHHHHAQVVSPN